MKALTVILEVLRTKDEDAPLAFMEEWKGPVPSYDTFDDFLSQTGMVSANMFAFMQSAVEEVKVLRQTNKRLRAIIEEDQQLSGLHDTIAELSDRVNYLESIREDESPDIESIVDDLQTQASAAAAAATPYVIQLNNVCPNGCQLIPAEPQAAPREPTPPPPPPPAPKKTPHLQKKVSVPYTDKERAMIVSLFNQYNIPSKRRLTFEKMAEHTEKPGYDFTPRKADALRQQITELRKEQMLNAAAHVQRNIPMFQIS